ncbi:MAG: hypothetical protein H5T91_09560 [Synergistetes bacterium]|nr:hypothetical protein [Synergistota bacterium]
MIDEAWLSGLPWIERSPFYHEREHGLLHEEAIRRVKGADRILTVYMGLETSMVAWRRGEIIDADNYSTGDSPMGVITSGWLPNSGLLSLLYERGFSLEEIKKLIWGDGGLKAYYGVERIEELAKREGDAPFEAFIYWTIKGIGGMSAILKGKPDVVIIGGPWSNYRYILERLKKHLSFLTILESEKVR